MKIAPINTIANSNYHHNIKRINTEPSFNGGKGRAIGGFTGVLAGIGLTTLAIASGGLLFVPAAGVLLAGGAAAGGATGAYVGDKVEGKDKE